MAEEKTHKNIVEWQLASHTRNNPVAATQVHSASDRKKASHTCYCAVFKRIAAVTMRTLLKVA